MKQCTLATRLTILCVTMAAWTGCTGGGAVTGPLTCAADAECDATEICHPDARICVQTCAAAADCEATAPKCDVVGGSSPASETLICRCEIDPQCGDGLICVSSYGVCFARCEENEDCGADATCDEATGRCVIEAP